MALISATAPGKIILFGEHAVVYGRPAIAVPVNQVWARSVIIPQPQGTPGHIQIQAPDIGLDESLSNLPDKHPLAEAVKSVLDEFGLHRSPACLVRVASTIPIAAGLGSGAAITVAILRAFSAFLGHPLADERVNALAFEVDKIYHGTPSGIDNTVITYRKPVYFQRGVEYNQMDTLRVGAPFTVIIGDTGMPSPTATVVGDVRQAWQAEPERYEALFEQIGEVVRQARQAIETGQPADLGELLRQNQALLSRVGVSSPALDRLVAAAEQAGALGSKLSGSGRGGNMIALAPVSGEVGDIASRARQIEQALRAAGAVRTIVTRIDVEGA